MTDSAVRSLSGRVTYTDGRPVVGMQVRAVAMTAMDEQQLAEVDLAGDGRYQIALPDDGGGDPRRLNLQARLVGPDGGELVLSEVRFGSLGSESIDLVLTNEMSVNSEFDRYAEAAREALAGGELGSVEAAQVEFLRNDLGIPSEHLEALVEAVRRHEPPGSDLPPLPVEVWYGWHRAGLGLDPGLLWQRGPAELTGALQAMATAGVLPTGIHEQVDALSETIRGHRLEHLLDSVPPAASGPLRPLLGTMPAPLDPAAQRSVAEVLFDHRPHREDLPGSLTRAGLSPDQVGRVVRTLRLAELTRGHEPLIAALQPLAGDDIDGSLQPLSSLPADRWLDLVYEHGAVASVAGGATGNPAQVARAVRARVEALHPSATLAARLSDGSVRLPISGGELVGDFLTSHPDFDLVKTPIEAYLAGLQPDPNPDDVALGSVLHTIRRLKPLTATWDELSTLLELGFDGPSDIAGLDEDYFLELLDLRIPAREARKILLRSSRLQEAAIALSQSLRGESAGVAALPVVLPSAEVRSQHPTLQSLFGSLDRCACGQCRSVLSPSAYLVDLLRFVHEGPPQALSTLLGRRPDLVDLELSCENAQQELPAIDLALEVLENAVGLPLTVDLPPGTDVTAALAGQRLPDAVVAVLQRTATDSLGAGLRARHEPTELAPDGSFAWTVADRHRRWTLQQSRESLRATVAGKERRTQSVPPDGLDFSAAVVGLDGGTVAPELDGLLRPLVAGKSLPAAVLAPGPVEVVEPGRRWRLAYRAELLAVTTMSTSDQGTIRLVADDGSEVMHRSYSKAAVEATAAALEAGEAGGMLQVLIPESRAYGAAPGASAGQSFKLSRRPIYVELSYTPSALTVAALTYQSVSEDGAVPPAASPRNRNPAAYQRLRDVVFPWSLPFDLPLEETRALLGRAGVPRGEVLESWLSSSAQRSFQVAMEHLGLSAQDVHLMTTPMLEPDLWRVWGAHDDVSGVVVWDAAAGEQVSGPPLSVFSRVSVLLQQARISQDELTELLATRFVRGAGVTPASLPPGECRPSMTRLDPVDPVFFDRLHRFIRLWRKLGWTVGELDAAIAAVGDGDLTTATVHQISYLARVHEQLSVPIDALATWWSDSASLHARLFGDIAARGRLDPDFELNDDGTALRVEQRGPNTPPTALADKLVGLAGAFGRPASELATFLGALPMRVREVRPLRLSLQTLTRLWRAVDLARALGLSAEDYVRAVRVTQIEPFPMTSVGDESPPAPRFVLEFCNAVALVRGSAVTFEELAYVLRHDPDPRAAIGLTDQAVAGILAGLRTAMAAARRDIAEGDAEPAVQVRAALATLGWYPELVDDVVSDLADLGDAPVRARLERRLSAAELPVFSVETTMLDGPLTVGGRLRDRCRSEPTASGAGSRIVVSGWVEPADEATLRAALGGGHDAAVDHLRALSDAYRERSTRRRLLSAPELASLSAVSADERYLVVVHAVIRHRRIRAAAGQLAQSFGLTPDVTADLVLDLLAIPGTSTPAITLALQPSFAEIDPRAEITAAAFPQLFALARRLHKIALLATRLNLDGPTLTALAGTGPQPLHRGAGVLGIDLNALPGGLSGTDVAVPFVAWRRMVALVRLRSQADGAGMMAAYAQAVLAPGRTPEARRAAALEVVARSTGQPSDTVGAVGQQVFSFGLTYDDPLGIEAVLRLLGSLARLGVRPDRVPDLISHDATEQGADLARSLLRARYPDASWPDVIRAVSDTLRVRQRDALVDYLVSHRKLTGADALYEHLLIDVLTAPCLSTTRILQATASVQLFIHRCLMNLEPAVVPKGINRRRWEWMKSYRVWEANRKVFLWPQNWLHPELREDASDAFRGVMSSLGQEEPSTEAARSALLGYLDDLLELSQVTVVGLYQHRRGPGPDGPSDLYVVGRSAEPPVRHFWRVCEDIGGAGMRWHPWQRVDLDITGTHVMPFVLNGDLHLAWPMLRKVQSSGDATWELQMAWARRSSRGWSQKSIGRTTVTTPALINKDEPSSFTFTLDVQTVAPSATTAEAVLLTRAAAEECAVIASYAAVPRDGTIPIPPEKQEYVEMTGSTAAISARLSVKVRAYARSSGTTWIAAGAQAVLTLTNGNGVRQFPWQLGSGGEWSTSFPEETVGFSIKPESWSLTLQVEYQGKRSEVRSFNRPSGPSLPLRLNWEANFIFEAAEAPSGLADPERAVSWGLLGSFVLSPSGGMSWQSGRGAAYLGRLAASDVQYENGIREGLSREVDDLTVVGPTGRVTLASTPGRFDLVPANPAREPALGRPTTVPRDAVWHYHDGAAQYYLHHLPSGLFRVDADGYPLAARFRADAATDLGTLFDPRRQAITDGGTLLSQIHRPTQAAVDVTSRTRQGVVFDHAAPYGLYNWELFLHVPVLVAAHLSRQQRFEEAEDWLRLVFDPTSAEARSASPADPSLYWRFLPFRVGGRPDRIEDLLGWLANPATAHEARDFVVQINRWKDNPFRPHEIARMRPGAYQWDVLFAYLDNLFDWADQRFRRYTRESLVEATMLYVQVATLLGPRPRTVQPSALPPSLTYRELAGRWDDFSNAWISLAETPLAQAVLPDVTSEPGESGPSGGPVDDQALAALRGLGITYFCVPVNDRLLEYWKRLEDRLFNIRHCRNIDGVASDLPLFEPPIDPDLLVRAVAAGIDIDQAVADAAAPLPQQRFAVLLARADALAGELRSLGGALLSALEKKDAERLARLRSGHEVVMLELAGSVRREQVDEANANVDALQGARDAAASRYAHYQYLLTGVRREPPEPGSAVVEEPSKLALAPSTVLAGDEQGLGLVTTERDQLGWLAAAGSYALWAGISNTVAAVFFAMGSYKFFEPLQGWGHAANAIGSGLNTLAANANQQASRDALIAGYQRRRDEWTLQSNNALREIAQIDKQIAAARIRVAIAELELTNHGQQLTQSRQVDDFMRDKYTNDQLYEWMTGQLAATYFGTYQLALDMARRAEQALRYQLYQPDARFIRPSYWDSLHKGLMAGDLLAQDLRRMESAALERDRREHELTRHISLRQLDPPALLQLRATGACTFDIPETLFDLDSPGHYLRRIKTVAVTMPAVAGPHAAAHAKLSLLWSTVRHRASGESGYPREPRDDPRFTDDRAVVESVVTSGTTEASGVWEPSLRDERRMPFEGRGAISRWRLELPAEFRQFDYDTIADVVLTMRYSARDGGERMRVAAVEALDERLAQVEAQPMALMLSLRHEYPSEWARLSAPGEGDRTEILEIPTQRFPAALGRHTLKVQKVDVFTSPQDAAVPTAGPVLASPATAGAASANLTFTSQTAVGVVRHDQASGLDVAVAEDAAAARWRVSMNAAAARTVRDVVLVLTYSATRRPAPVTPLTALATPAPQAPDANAGPDSTAVDAPPSPALRERDPQRAVHTLRSAVEHGSTAAAYDLGVLLLQRGDLDPAEAALRQATEGGHLPGAHLLGLMLWHDRRDPVAAIAALDRAAQAGHPDAARDLGLLLREQGDDNGARYWLTRAAERGALDTSRALAELEGQ